MGKVTSGIPRAIATSLARAANIDAFVESGTNTGKTARWASNIFHEVHTIERSNSLYASFANSLAPGSNIHSYLGDSRDVLPGVLQALDGKRALYWLDGHWSGGNTAGEDDECPLLGELTAIRGRSDDVILIDDARLFTAAPPKPHKIEQWPTLVELIDQLRDIYDNPLVQIIDDVIFVVPRKSELAKIVMQYAQRRADEHLSSTNAFLSLCKRLVSKARLKLARRSLL